LSGPSGRLVVDRTGLDGYYEVDLLYAPDLGPSDANDLCQISVKT
jgi:hypothetical protein